MAVNIGPRIGIDGEKEYRNAINNIIAQQKLLTAEMKKTSVEFSSSTDAQKKNAAQVKILNEQIDNQKERVKQLSSMMEQSAQKYGDSATETLKWKQALTEAQTELIAMENQLQSMTGPEALAKQMQEAGDQITKGGQAITKVGDTLTKTVTAPLVGVGTAAVKMASDYENALAKVSTIADTSAVPMERMSKAITDLSNETGIAATDVADAVYNAISAGQDTADAVNFVSNATKLARAGFADTASATDILTTALNAYGLEASEVSRVSDVLITTQNLGKTTVAELASQMGRAIPTAKAQGVSIENLAAMYAVLTANGINTAQTTTYLSGMLNELGKAGSTADKAFRAGTASIKQGGLSMQEAMDSGWSLTDVLEILDQQAAKSGVSISNMFGSAEAGKAATVLWDNATQVNEVVMQMGESAGATEAAYQKLETSSFSVEKSMNQLKNAGTELGGTMLELLQPTIEGLSSVVSDLSEWVSGLSDTEKENIVRMAAMVAAAGPVISIVGRLTTGVGSAVAIGGKLVGTFSNITSMSQLMGVAVGALTSPLGITVAAITGAIAVGVLLYKNWDTIKATAQSLGAKISSVFTSIGTKISSVMNSARNTVANSINGIKNLFNFSWSLPRIKMPHFSVSWSSLGWGLSLPHISVSWYKKAYNQAMMFSSPTVLGTGAGLKGFGDGAGNEIVIGENYLMSTITSAVQKAGGAGTTINVTVNPSEGMDEAELADLVAERIDDAIRRDQEVFA